MTNCHGNILTYNNMKIYTKTGDKGTTSLAGGTRVGKDDLRVEAYGCVDELSAFLGYLRDHFDSEETALDEYNDDIRIILNTLMSVEALLASCGSEEYKLSDITENEIRYLENRIDYISSQLVPVTRFTIPGGHPLVSLTHICRTVCRRSERAAVKASREHPVSENVISYLNRLSDYLYQLGRKLSDELAANEVYWEPAANAGKNL